MTQENSKDSKDKAISFVKEFLTDFVKKHPLSILLFFVYLVIVILQDIALPHFSGKLVNAIQNKHNLVKPFLIILAIIIGIQALYTYNEWQDTLLYPEMHGLMRDKMVDHILKAYSSNYAEIDVASVLMRAIKLPATLFTFLDQLRYVVTPYIFVYAATTTYIMMQDVTLGLIVLVCQVILFVSVFMSPQNCEKSAFDAERKTITIADHIEDVLNNLISVFSQNQEDKEREHIHKQHEELVEQQAVLAKCIYQLKFAMFPVMAVFIAAFMYRCFILVKTKRMDAGRFVALFMILTYISNSMWRIIAQMRDTIPRWGRIREGLTMFEKPQVAQDVETYKDDIVSHQQALSASNNAIVVEQVFFKYPDSTNFILKGLNLIIPDRQKVAIVGRIGCGKSTLLKLIMKYYTPTRGNLYWHGLSYTQMTTDDVRATVGYVHQNPALFKRSIYDNITYGLDPKIVTPDVIMAILRHIKMETIFDNISDGLHGNAGRKGSKLSGGQKQMVWLLRIFFKQPDILILDEPTASVDLETKQAIQVMLELVMKNKTVIIVTHDRFLLDYVDRVITLDNGKVAKDEMIRSTT